ncbi:Ig-like domain-containing protein [Tahibacter harae]|uniref:Ig-like domain-containing protein n=1 Tax=Tahibacter harae TaxID=2963937 RepID=A0ABT1QW98_9GAMM|nr:Ig-like domain-containing protein [Tahibacter harae]MCQ4166548.1 Ig-like domain-containing protein [Tahibacter harae]
MRRSLLALSISFALCSAAAAQNTAAPDRPAANDPSIPLTYVGANARVSLGVNEDGDVNGEALGIFGFDGDSAWIGQLWLAQGGAGGVQFDYHWLLGGKTRQDTIDNPDSVRVAKAFVAVDQNVWNDRKATVGVGYQKNDFFVDGYLSGAISGKRFIGSTTDVTTATLSGVENGHAYTQLQTTTLITDAFEHPYDHGIGLRLGRYFDDSLWRIRGGLDYERGKYNSDQLTLSLGVDKYIRNTGWSLSLDGEQLKKSGDFEFDENDTRGWLSLRYEFGQSYRPREPYRMVEVVTPAPQVAQAAAEPTLVRNDVRLDGDAFFNFDHADLRPDAIAALDALLAKLNGNTRVSRITITGHTDSVGSEAYNQALSERRAASAKAYLVSRGVPAEQIDTRGAGELNPSFPNDTAANRQKNRRVDIEFLSVEETSTPAPAAQPGKDSVEWKREPVAAPAAWIERALRNPAQHKRTVDVYRFERATTTTTLGPRTYANTAPDAVDDAIAIPFGSPAVTIDVLGNDTDPENDTLTVTGVTQPAHGSVTYTATGVTFTPSPVHVGIQVFTYTISDGHGGTDTAFVGVTVGGDGVNRPPVAADDSASTAVGTPVNIRVLDNDSDPENDPLTVASVGTPAHGQVVINRDASVTYTPAAGFEGTDSFTYVAGDSRGQTATARVSVTVGGSGGNRPPVAMPDEFGMLKGVGANLAVLANDSDPDGDTLRVIAVENLGPHRGTVSINPDGTIRFEHQHGTNGRGKLRYTITDDHGHEASAEVVIRITEIPF